MATFTLTSGSDNFTGTGNAVDHFVGFAVPGFSPGVSGGFDTLNGGAGNDHFYLDSGASGTLEGGIGTDVLHAYGTGLNSVTITGVEVLDLASEDPLVLLNIAASQLSLFSTLTGHVFAGGRIALELGVNADLNFGSLIGPTATFGVDAHITGIISNGLGSFTVTGTRNNDRFTNETGNNASGIYDGGAGNDIFIADNSGGLDILRGGAGNDLFDLDGTSSGLGGVKVSNIEGGTGVDEIEATNTSLLDIEISGVETLNGSHISLTSAQLAQFATFEDVSTPFLFLSGAGGNHNFTGRTPGGLSLDCSQATSGGTYVFGASDDRWVGSQQHDETVRGGAGNDTIAVTLADPADINDEVHGGDGDDRFIITSDLAAGSANGSRFGIGPEGAFLYEGGAGKNTLAVGGLTGRITGVVLDNFYYLEFSSVGIFLVLGTIDGFEKLVDIFSIERSSLDDEVQRVKLGIEGAGGTLDLTTKAETLTPNVGVELDGTAVTSALNATGSTRSDKITTTGFADVLAGGLGADQLFGGLGNDTYNLGAEASGRDQVGDGGGTGDKITSTITRSLAHVEFAEIEHLTLLGAASINGTGNGLANIITGNGGANILDGGADSAIDTLRGLLGNDTYVLGNGADRVQDTGGIDTITSTVTRSLAGFAGIENLKLLGAAAINGTGSGLANIITGNDGVNILRGAGGNDTVSAGAGNDVLIGGAGADRLNGGVGLDVIRYDAMAETGATAATRDVILGFQANADRIDLAAIDAIPGGPNNAFAFQGTAAFTAAGQIRLQQSGADTIVSLNTVGTTGAEAIILLKGVTATTLDAGDFVL